MESKMGKYKKTEIAAFFQTRNEVSSTSIALDSDCNILDGQIIKHLVVRTKHIFNDTDENWLCSKYTSSCNLPNTNTVAAKETIIHLWYFRKNIFVTKFTLMLALSIQSSSTDNLQMHSVNCSRHDYNA